MEQKGIPELVTLLGIIAMVAVGFTVRHNPEGFIKFSLELGKLWNTILQVLLLPLK